MNLKSQKGATGVDIIVSISIIVFTVAIISMIYVNTTLQSRNVRRTAGATRIATNILENIEKMSYVEFLITYGDFNDDISYAGSFNEDGVFVIDRTSTGIDSIPWESSPSTGEFKDYKCLSGNSGVALFGTKIPRGYTVYFYAPINNGMYTENDMKFDLVREIHIAVVYSVGNSEEKVEFTSSKSREMMGVANAPVTDVLKAQSLLNGKKYYYPIKYSNDAKAYIKTTEDDVEWYNYEAKKWAFVLVSAKPEDEIFDLNGKFISTFSNDNVRYVWLPKYCYTGTGSSKAFSGFAYNTSSREIMTNQALKSNNGSGSVLLYYNAIGESKATESFRTGASSVELPGKWIKANSVSDIEDDVDGKIINDSEYGPCEIY